MAFGTGIPSNAGQGADGNPQDIIPEVEENFSDTSSESESEDDDSLISGAGQRRHGVLDDETRARRRLANAELDARFESLRAILPNTIRGDRYSSMMPACERVMQLHRSIEDLKYQTDLASEMLNTPGSPLVRPSPQGVPFGMQIPRMTSIDGISHENPKVEVLRDPLRVNGQLEVNIACVNRSGLLIDIIAALDLKGFCVSDGSIACHENILFASLYVEKDNPVTPVDAGSQPHPEPRPEPRQEPRPESEEDEALKESVLCVIRQDTSAGSPDNNSN